MEAELMAPCCVADGLCPVKGLRRTRHLGQKKSVAVNLIFRMESGWMYICQLYTRADDSLLNPDLLG